MGSMARGVEDGLKGESVPAGSPELDGRKEPRRGRKLTMKADSNRAGEPTAMSPIRRAGAAAWAHPGGVIILIAPLLAAIGAFLPRGSMAAMVVLGAAIPLAILGELIAIATNR